MVVDFYGCWHYTVYGLRRRITASTKMQVRFRVTCDKNWFGSDCNVECVPVTGRYTCDSTGRKLCESGWMGFSCDIIGKR